MAGDADERSLVSEERAAPADPRAIAAWQAWLKALATDAEAAFAAALAYESLDGASRDTWLDALEQDAFRAGVPRIAIYAPLLAVETDPSRLRRIHHAIGDERAPLPAPVEARALRGVAPDASRVVVLVLPLYLSFVQVFACRFSVNEGFTWAKHDPFAKDDDAPRAGQELDGVHLERTPMKPVVEELAHAVLAQNRRGVPAPPELRVLIDLFSPEPDGGELARDCRGMFEIAFYGDATGRG